MRSGRLVIRDTVFAPRMRTFPVSSLFRKQRRLRGPLTLHASGPGCLMKSMLLYLLEVPPPPPPNTHTHTLTHTSHPPTTHPFGSVTTHIHTKSGKRWISCLDIPEIITLCQTSLWVKNGSPPPPPPPPPPPSSSSSSSSSSSASSSSYQGLGSVRTLQVLQWRAFNWWSRSVPRAIE